MDFFINFFVYGGILAPTPIDRAAFPMRTDTFYEERTSIGSQREEFHLVGPSILRRSRMTLWRGLPANDTDWTEYGIRPDGLIGSVCDSIGCDFRQEGKEYGYAGGVLSLIRRFRDGRLRDSIPFEQLGGRVVGGANGQFKVTWVGDKVASLRQGDDVIFKLEEFEYPPSGDSLKVRFHESIGDPQVGVETYHLLRGRPTLRFERDSTGLFSTKFFHYNISTAALRPRGSGSRFAAWGPWRQGFDALGRPGRTRSAPLGLSPL